MSEAPLMRPLPVITDMNSYFWRSGGEGLRILRCGGCDRYSHPYVGRCPSCGSRDVKPQTVSGRATVVGFTVNHQPWFPHVPVPYVIAYVELEEQSDIRLATNIVNCPVEDVAIGMKVKVVFEKQDDDIYIPLFEPA